MRHDPIKINPTQAALIFKMYYKDKNRTKYERVLCLKQIVGIILNNEDDPDSKIKLLSKELDIRIIKLNRIPQKWREDRREERYNVFDMRDKIEEDAPLFVIIWKSQSSMKQWSEKRELCLINVDKNPDFSLIPILRAPLVYSLLEENEPIESAVFYKVMLDTFNEFHFNRTGLTREDLIRKTCKLRTSVRKLFGFIDNDVILQSLLSMMRVKRMRTSFFVPHEEGVDPIKATFEFRFAKYKKNLSNFRKKFEEKSTYFNKDVSVFVSFAVLTCLQPWKKEGAICRINDPIFLYEFQKTVFNIVKRTGTQSKDSGTFTREHLKEGLLSILKEEKRLKYERLLCIQTLFSLFYSETKDEKKTRKQLKKVGVFLKPVKESQNPAIHDGIEVIDMREKEKYPWNKYFYYKAFNMPYTKEHFLINTFFDESDSQTDAVLRALEKYIMLTTPIVKNFFSQSFAFMCLDNFHKIFDFKGETVNLTERLFQEVKKHGIRFGKNNKEVKTSKKQRLQNLFTKLLKPPKPKFLSYGFHEHIETLGPANDLLKNVFSAFFRKPAEPTMEDKSHLFLRSGLKRNHQFIKLLQKNSQTVKYHIQDPNFIYLFQKYLFDYIVKGDKPRPPAY